MKRDDKCPGCEGGDYSGTFCDDACYDAWVDSPERCPLCHGAGHILNAHQVVPCFQCNPTTKETTIPAQVDDLPAEGERPWIELFGVRFYECQPDEQTTTARRPR